MMKEDVAPRLRELGFKGSGQRFELPSEDFWALIGFQKSQWGSKEEVSFTVNITVASRRRWDEARQTRPYLGERPAPNSLYTAPKLAMQDYIWQSRIGFLLPAGTDWWWELDPATDTRQLADDVVSAIRDYALPAMRERLLKSGS